MADTVTIQVLEDGPRNAVVAITGISDGTGETGAVKVDASALSGDFVDLAIEKIIYSTSGVSLDFLFDATADVLAWTIAADQDGCADFGAAGGIKNNAGAGKTGDILLTSRGGAADDAYSAIIFVKKNG